ncbi:MAG: prephenate dehydratase, partial [Flavobacteriaceae bacterium]|nr:prephenate dehydratase [Flavobacteriaceae bacterium]
MENNNKIAIQGIKGSYHHVVAELYFGKSVKILPCSSFDELVNSILDNSASQGIMAIENSIAGSIIPNYALI